MGRARPYRPASVTMRTSNVLLRPFLRFIPAAAWLLAQPTTAHADGFALNRFEPAGPGSSFFSGDSLGLHGKSRWAVGVTGDYAHKPLVAYNADGSENTVILGNQLFAHAGVAWIGFSRLRLNASLPVLLYQNGTASTVGTTSFAPAERAGVGDLRLAADLRLFGENRKGFELAAGLRVHVPTGQAENLTSDGQARLAPRVQAAGTLGSFEYTARVGTQVRWREADVAGVAFGSELELGTAGGFRLLDRKLLLGAEFWGTTVVSDGGDGFFASSSTAFEIIGSGRYWFTDDWNASLGVGPGLTRGLGAPTVRTLLGIEWAPTEVVAKAPPPDRDGDGVLDGDDACSSQPGPKSLDAARSGCPVPLDFDADGIVDADDQCRTEPGAAPTGCPPPKDSDGDGVADGEDACVQVAGIAVAEGTTRRGCPVPADTDKDGVVDAQDGCRDQVGVPTEDPQTNGCPVPERKGDQLIILQHIEFDIDAATIRPDSEPALREVLRYLQAHPEISKLEIQGHTDDRGGANRNVELSSDRAQAVVAWLVERGVDAQKLTSRGFGPGRPLAPNKDDAARQKNRRVELHVLSEDRVQGKSQ